MFLRILLDGIVYQSVNFDECFMAFDPSQSSPKTGLAAASAALRDGLPWVVELTDGGSLVLFAAHVDRAIIRIIDDSKKVG
jgi:hypothetical protein